MYPITLDLNGKPVLIIGAGSVGERKIMSVYNAGANITVISEHYSEPVKKLVREGKIRLIERSYQAGDCRGYFMVIGSTGSNAVNTAISQECTALGTLVNIVDQPELCSFHVPAVVTRGDFQIAVSTGGKSPALSREIRKELEEQYGDEYGRLTDRLGIIRKELKQKYSSDRAELSRRLQIVFKEEYTKFKIS
ncbi:hypothetical protein AMJ80_00965 [bacterium SM23_31]|nr:MAG: hypothetical protein AMJ80_00965 [bacterium SM23_31]